MVIEFHGTNFKTNIFCAHISLFSKYFSTVLGDKDTTVLDMYERLEVNTIQRLQNEIFLNF